jgi:hypothetical protein
MAFLQSSAFIIFQKPSRTEYRRSGAGAILKIAFKLGEVSGIFSAHSYGHDQNVHI